MKPSALLTLNPELQRNLWLELSPGRLIGMPVAIAVLAGIFYELFGKGTIFPLLTSIIWLLMILWGTRLAAETIGEEIAARTWDVQKLSAQRATTLTIGKFVGGTIYVWYGAAICGVAIAIISPANTLSLLDRALEGLVAQSTTLLAALVLTRFGSRRGLNSLAAQAVGIFVAGYESVLISHVTENVVAPSFMNSADNVNMKWFGHQLAIVDLMHGVEVVTVLWMLIATVRLIREDLGYRDGPTGWACFTGFAMLFAYGFANGRTDANPLWTMRLATVPLILAYLALLGLPASVQATRKFVARVRTRAVPSAWRASPPWLMAALLVIVAVADYAAGDLAFAYTGLAMLGFLCRDVVVVYGIRSRVLRRPNVMLVIYFVVVYAIAPFALHGSYLGRDPGPMQRLGMALFTPFSIGRAPWYAFFPWVEAVIAAIVLQRDLRRLVTV